MYNFILRTIAILFLLFCTFIKADEVADHENSRFFVGFDLAPCKSFTKQKICMKVPLEIIKIPMVYHSVKDRFQGIWEKTIQVKNGFFKANVKLIDFLSTDSYGNRYEISISIYEVKNSNKKKLFHFRNRFHDFDTFGNIFLNDGQYRYPVDDQAYQLSFFIQTSF